MKIFWSILTIVILALGSLAGAQEQAGQPCHNNKKDPLFGLYCPTINGSFVGPKNGSQLNTTTVINGVITPITGTLTFAPGPNLTPVVDDYDDSGNPICYQYDSMGTSRDDCLSVGCILRHHAVGHYGWRSSPGPQPTRRVSDQLVLRHRLQQQLQTDAAILFITSAAPTRTPPARVFSSSLSPRRSLLEDQNTLM
jgi:hypothetical protein